MILEFVIYTGLGVVIGYGLGTKERRANTWKKLRDITAPKKPMEKKE